MVAINYNIIKKIYDILLEDGLITIKEYEKSIDKLHKDMSNGKLKD